MFLVSLDMLLLVGIPVGFASSTVGLKKCAVTAGIKKYDSILKSKRKKSMTR